MATIGAATDSAPKSRRNFQLVKWAPEVVQKAIQLHEESRTAWRKIFREDHGVTWDHAGEEVQEHFLRIAERRLVEEAEKSFLPLPVTHGMA
ncbi:MAG: hypothetical protein ACTHQM_24750 [Thermoanaerobaculia bacterium]